ncbi:serine/threonine-protein kinase pim-1-like [Eucyclogobius newberryi]|uniref:serine/threonine-protein kinase pim-1-like n=1 Tax=Eucyclogobius newberryi TaxID=166745 RepID=UPI003B5B010C
MWKIYSAQIARQKYFAQISLPIPDSPGLQPNRLSQQSQDVYGKAKNHVSEEFVDSAKARCDGKDEGSLRMKFRTDATPKKHKFKAKYGWAQQKEQESEDRNIINHNTEEFNKKYMRTEFLEKGGFGQVFAGVRVEDNLPVALKFISKHLVCYTVVEMDGKFVKLPQEVNFLMKARAVTPRLLDWYKVGREIVLVLERPDPCLDLVDYINSTEHRMTPNKAKIIFRKLVDDAIYLDSVGIFHNDIKLENVLLGTSTDIPRAWFIDFGCASFFKPGQMFEYKHGTTECVPPEWFQGNKYTAENATVWQLGILLYAMVFADFPLLTEESLGSMRSVPIPRSATLDLKN